MESVAKSVPCLDAGTEEENTGASVATQADSRRVMTAGMSPLGMKEGL